MNTNSKVSRTIATAAVIAASCFATTACGVEEQAAGTISQPAKAPAVEKSFPYDGREHRNPSNKGPSTAAEKAPTE